MDSTEKKARKSAVALARYYANKEKPGYEEIRERKRKYALEYYYANRDKIRNKHKTDPATRERTKANRRAYYLAHKEQEKARRTALGKEYFRIAARKSYYKHRDAYRARQATWAKSPAGRRALYYTRSKSRYGLSKAQVDRLMIRAQGRCECCGALDERGRVLHIDHCHATGKVRGLLCANCNHSLGRIEDREEVLLAMLEYLRRGKSDEPSTG